MRIHLQHVLSSRLLSFAVSNTSSPSLAQAIISLRADSIFIPLQQNIACCNTSHTIISGASTESRYGSALIGLDEALRSLTLALVLARLDLEGTVHQTPLYDQDSLEGTAVIDTSTAQLENIPQSRSPPIVAVYHLSSELPTTPSIIYMSLQHLSKITVRTYTRT